MCTKASFTEDVTSFEAFNFDQHLLQGIYAYGFEEPTFIQQQAIQPIIDGKDLIAQAQSGQGKTGAFAIGLLTKIQVKLRGMQALVLAPSGELALQIAKVIQQLGLYMKVQVHCCKGGNSYKFDRKGLKSAHIVVGTPGRILDMADKDWLKFDHLKAVVIDEVDQVLGESYQETIDDIFNEYLKPDVQVALFSATVPKKQLQIMEELTQDPVKILLQIHDQCLKGITQYKVATEAEEKMLILTELMGSLEFNKVMVFANKTSTCREIAEQLKEYKVALICGGMKAREKQQNMSRFRTSKANILIATDQLARGIDFQGVQLVINFDIPYKIPTYIHRIGRTGRRTKGKAISFVTQKDQNTLDFMCKIFSCKIEECPEDLANFL